MVGYALMLLCAYVACAPMPISIPSYYYKRPTFTVLPQIEFQTEFLETPPSFSKADKLHAANNYLMTALNLIDRSAFIAKSEVEANGGLSVHYQAIVDGLAVVNSHAVVNVNSKNEVISMSSSWIDLARLQKRQITKVLSSVDAVEAFAYQMGYSFDRTKVKTKALPNGET